jgi:hypothetical protein
LGFDSKKRNDAVPNERTLSRCIEVSHTVILMPGTRVWCWGLPPGNDSGACRASPPKMCIGALLQLLQAPPVVIKSKSALQNMFHWGMPHSCSPSTCFRSLHGRCHLLLFPPPVLLPQSCFPCHHLWRSPSCRLVKRPRFDNISLKQFAPFLLENPHLCCQHGKF